MDHFECDDMNCEFPSYSNCDDGLDALQISSFLLQETGDDYDFELSFSKSFTRMGEEIDRCLAESLTDEDAYLLDFDDERPETTGYDEGGVEIPAFDAHVPSVTPPPRSSSGAYESPPSLSLERLQEDAFPGSRASQSRFTASMMKSEETRQAIFRQKLMLGDTAGYNEMLRVTSGFNTSFHSRKQLWSAMRGNRIC